MHNIEDAVAHGAAVRRLQTLEPAGGPGAIVFPPTYPEVGHLIYERRIGGETVRVCASTACSRKPTGWSWRWRR